MQKITKAQARKLVKEGVRVEITFRQYESIYSAVCYAATSEEELDAAILAANSRKTFFWRDL